jgi:solute carrier family 25 citrate transporter 1
MSGTKKGSIPATIAGSIAGATEILVIWPMEMIKTNLQLGSHTNLYTGMFAGFRYHIKNDGFISLYRGLTPVLMGSIPKAGIRFGAFDFFKRNFEGENEDISPFRSLAAGVCAGGIEAVLVTTPVGKSIVPLRVYATY